MTHPTAKLTVNSQGIDAQLGQTLLAAAEAGGFTLQHDCSAGHCEGCRVVVEYGAVDDHGTRLKNTVLACKATLSGDAEIRQATSAGLQSLKGHVSALRQVSDSLIELRLSFTKPISWRPGQYYRVEVRGQAPVNLHASFALDASTEFNTLIFLIERDSTPDLFGMIVKKGDIKGRVGVTGPYGTSFISHDDERLIIVAGPQGIAPSWAMILSSIMGQPRREKLLFLDESLRQDQYQQIFNWLKRRGFEPVFADLQGDGAVDRLRARLPDLTEFDMAYVAGTPAFIAGVEPVFVEAQATYARIPQHQPQPED